MKFIVKLKLRSKVWPGKGNKKYKAKELLDVEISMGYREPDAVYQDSGKQSQGALKKSVGILFLSQASSLRKAECF